MWDMEVLDKMEKIYDTIEKSTGPGVVVTIGTGRKYFCTGFNLEWWLKAPENMIMSIARA